MAQLFYKLSTKTTNFQRIASILQKYGHNQHRSHLYVRQRLLCSNLGRNHNILPTKKGTRLLNDEYVAVLQLVRRSLPSFSQFSRNFASSSRYSQQSNGSNENKTPNGNNDDDKMAMAIKALFWAVTGYILISVLALLFPSGNQPEIVRYVSWTEFLHLMLAKGEVEQVIVRPDVDTVTILLHSGAIVKGRPIGIRVFHMNIIDTNQFEEKLRAAEQNLGIPSGKGIPVVYERNSDMAVKLLITLVAGVIVLSLFSKMKFDLPSAMGSMGQMGKAKFTLVDSLNGPGKGVRFADVAGLKEVKIEVMEFVDYLKRPEHYKKLGAKVPKGALLLGPPGCGKTLLAKAVATEAGVPFLSMNGSEFIEMIGGLGAARVRDLFKEARKRSPCIIYIDEIDAIGRQRSQGGGTMDGASGESEQTLNQLLVEMDGMGSREGVLMLASTNRADVLDKALLRPGRFDRHIMIDLPTLEERQEIFEQHLKSIKLEKEPQFYSKRMGSLTPGFSGADIANVCNEAALHAARFLHKEVTSVDMEYAIERVVGGLEKRSSVIAPNQKRIVAYHECGHALVGWLLPHTDALLKVTIVPRTSQALGFAQYTPTDKRLYSTEELFERMCMALGGRVAESLTFNRITTGAQNDLQKVTKMAYSQVRSYGMSEAIGPISFPEQDSQDFGCRPYSKTLANAMDEEARSIIAKAYKRTERLLIEHKELLEKLAEALLEKETLNFADVELLIGPPPHGQKNFIEPLQFEAELNEQANNPAGKI